MSKLKRMLPLLAFSLLAACQSSGTTFKPLSTPQTALTAQTDQVKVTIQCGEHEPDQSLPAYPNPTGSDLAAYSTSQSVWAARVSGVFAAEKILRHNTALCLDQLRAKGLIN